MGGFTSGVVASLVVQPLDVIRTRLVGQGEPKVCIKELHMREMRECTKVNLFMLQFLCSITKVLKVLSL